MASRYIPFPTASLTSDSSKWQSADSAPQRSTSAIRAPPSSTLTQAIATAQTALPQRGQGAVMVMRALDLVSVWEQAVGWGRSMVGLGLLRRIRGTHLPHKEVQGKTDGRIPDYRARVVHAGANLRRIGTLLEVDADSTRWSNTEANTATPSSPNSKTKTTAK